MHPNWDHSHLVPSQMQHELCCWVAPAPVDASTGPPQPLWEAELSPELGYSQIPLGIGCNPRVRRVLNRTELGSCVTWSTILLPAAIVVHHLWDQCII